MSPIKTICKILLTAVDMLLFAIIHIWDFFESVLFVVGFILCMLMPVYWPWKFVAAIIWLIVFYSLSKLIGLLQTNRERRKLK